ncbi:MAG: T9SS type A sorting domain-containing protein [Saprospiraceae bacterium]|nr:T9SS type A sorting domain-containing protein [Saprospiraceae bacterium]
MWKSTDGGATFVSISNGLPATMVQELAAMPDETMLFAATDVGPYVYVAETNTWYPLRNSLMPLQRVMGVEMIAARNLVRFGTFGRGVWDFAIDNMELAAVVTPSNNGPNSGSIALTTTKGLAPYTYHWDHGNASKDLTNLAPGEYHVTVMDANGFVREGDFVVAGSGQQAAGSGAKAEVWRGAVAQDREAEANMITTHLRLYPNPAKTVCNIDFEGVAPVGYTVEVMDATGKTIHRGNSSRLDVSGWAAGTYVVSVKSGEKTWAKRLVKV